MNSHKEPLAIDVMTAARSRIELAFKDFGCVYVAFSGGKDSGVLLELALERARIEDRLPLDVLVVDLEGQYQHTIEYVEKMMTNPEVRPWWICLPLHLRNAVSQFQPFWMCWDPDKKSDWIRSMPTAKGVISDESYFSFFQRGMEFEEFVPLFGKWLAKRRRKHTVCLVGIRADESLNRYRTVKSTVKETWRGKQWTTRLADDLYNAYPIYDWQTRDIWIANGKMGWNYNKIYDLMHLAGLSVHQMRLCQPYGDDQRRGLWLFQLLEPQTWNRVVARVEGANFGARHAGNRVLGHLKVSLPKEHTWESYTKLMLATMPPPLATHYSTKIETFLRWWAKKGYANGIPDYEDKKEEARRKVPSWRRIAKVIMKNDYWCKGLSFAPTKREHERRLKLALGLTEMK